MVEEKENLEKGKPSDLHNVAPISTHLVLCRNVGVTLNTGVQRYFHDPVSQYEYFYKHKKYETNNASYIREQGTILIDLSFKEMRDVNYILFKNNDYDDKQIFAYVTDVLYVSAEVSEIIFAIDVFQTYLFDVRFQESYVERCHKPEYYVLNGKKRPIYNTQPEGIYYGSEYKTIDYNIIQPVKNVSFLVVVSTKSFNSLSTSGGADIGGTFLGGVSQLNYAVIPINHVGKKFKVDWGEGFLDITTPSELFRNVKDNEDWANAIVHMYYTEFTNLSFDVAEETSSTIKLVLKPQDRYKITAYSIKDSKGYLMKVGSFSPSRKTFQLAHPDNVFKKERHSKLLAYPYSVVVLNDMKGNILEIKPDGIYSDKMILDVMGNIGNNPKVIYQIRDYKNTTGIPFNILDYHNSAMINTSTNELPVVVSHLSALMQSKRNQIDASKNNAHNSYMGISKNAEAMASAMHQNQAVNQGQAFDWYDIAESPMVSQAKRGGKYSGQMQGSGIGQSWGLMGGSIVGGGLKTLASAVGGGAAATGLGMLGAIAPIGIGIGGAIAGAKKMGQASEDRAIANAYDNLNMQNALNMNNAMYQNERLSINNNLATQMMMNSAQVSLENSLNSIMAGVSDASNVSPSMLKMGGGDSFEFAQGWFGILVEYKQITAEYKEILNQYFDLFGYKENKIRRLIFHDRERWNYIKTKGLNVSGKVPHIVRETYKTIFDNGVFLFHDDKVGDFSGKNEWIGEVLQ